MFANIWNQSPLWKETFQGGLFQEQAVFYSTQKVSVQIDSNLAAPTSELPKTLPPKIRYSDLTSTFDLVFTYFLFSGLKPNYCTHPYLLFSSWLRSHKYLVGMYISNLFPEQLFFQLLDTLEPGLHKWRTVLKCAFSGRNHNDTPLQQQGSGQAILKLTCFLQIHLDCKWKNWETIFCRAQLWQSFSFTKCPKNICSANLTT